MALASGERPLYGENIMSATLKCLASAVDHWAVKSPDNIALQDENGSMSYAQLSKYSKQIASALLGCGFKKGDRIAYYGRNSALYFALFTAATRASLVIVPVGWRLAAPEVAYILNDTDSRLLVHDIEYEPIISKIKDSLPKLKTILVKEDSPTSFSNWLANAPQSDVPVHDPMDAVLQLYTSGTTGLPKGAVLNSWSMFVIRNEPDMAQYIWARMDEGDSMLIVMPVAHIAGSGTAAVAFFNGAKAITQREFAPDAVLKSIDDGVTHMFLVPTAIQMLIHHPNAKDTDFYGFKYMWYGAAPIPLDLLRNAMQVMGNTQFCQQYGMTETTGSFCVLAPEDHDPAGNDHMRSAGKALPGVEVRIMGENGEELPRGEIGEIATRSALNMIEYWKNPLKTAETINADGWLFTGDAGLMDNDGYVFIQDRIKDMIITGGENVYPAEVENIVFSHADVMEVAVIGIPNEKWGEEVKAIIVPKQGVQIDEAAMIAWLRERMSAYKVPKSISVIDAMPRNASGKILRRELRDPYWVGHDKKV